MLRIPSKNLPTDKKQVNHRTLLDGFTLDDIDYLVEVNPYLRGYLQGYLAELSLQRQLEDLNIADSVNKIPDHSKSKGDLEVVYKGIPITIEVKSIQSNSVKEDYMTEAWSGTVGIKNTDKRSLEINGKEVTSTRLVKGTFDILAISCFAVNNSWDFLFIENRLLPENDKHAGLIPTTIIINPNDTPGLTTDISKLLEKVYLQKTQSSC